jgi:hypothetical protein
MKSGYRSRYSDSYGLDDQGVGFRVPMEERIFSSPCCPGRHCDPLSLLSNGYRGLFTRGVKPPGHEADHSHITGAEAKKVWIYTSAPSYAFMA